MDICCIYPHHIFFEVIIVLILFLLRSPFGVGCGGFSFLWSHLTGLLSWGVTINIQSLASPQCFRQIPLMSFFFQLFNPFTHRFTRTFYIILKVQYGLSVFTVLHATDLVALPLGRAAPAVLLAVHHPHPGLRVQVASWRVVTCEKLI